MSIEEHLASAAVSLEKIVGLLQNPRQGIDVGPEVVNTTSPNPEMGEYEVTAAPVAKKRRSKRKSKSDAEKVTDFDQAQTAADPTAPTPMPNSDDLPGAPIGHDPLLDPEPEALPVATLEQISASLRELASIKGRPAIIALLAQHNATKLNEILPEDFGVIHNEIQTLLRSAQ